MASKLSLFYPAPSLNWHLITMTGPDALDFLHRLTTVNLKELSPGEGRLGCFLTPQGKFRAFFTLWYLGPESFAFEFEGGADQKWKKELLATIEQFTFGEKFILEEKSLSCAWLLGEKAEAKFQTDEIEAGVRVFRHGHQTYSHDWISVWGEPSALDAWIKQAAPEAKTLTLEALENWRVQSTFPRVDHEITDAANPLETGLRDAIAPNKGCYPGQEIIEKIVALGSPARRLVRLDDLGSEPSQGENLYSESNEVGKITSATRATSTISALAIVKKTVAKEGSVTQLQNGETAKVSHVTPYQ